MIEVTVPYSQEIMVNRTPKEAVEERIQSKREKYEELRRALNQITGNTIVLDVIVVSSLGHIPEATEATLNRLFCSRQQEYEHDQHEQL